MFSLCCLTPTSFWMLLSLTETPARQHCETVGVPGKRQKGGGIAGFMSASSLTDIFYLVSRNVGVSVARQAVRTCLKTLQICTVDYATLDHADQLPGSDFEDNVQIACALRYGLDAIVTHDKVFYKGFIPVLSPAELLKRI